MNASFNSGSGSCSSSSWVFFLLLLELLLEFLFRLLVGCPDVLADERLAHHLHDSLGFWIAVQDAPRVSVVFLFRLVADRVHLDVAEVEELLLGQLGARVSRATRGTSGNRI